MNRIFTLSTLNTEEPLFDLYPNYWSFVNKVQFEQDLKVGYNVSTPVVVIPHGGIEERSSMDKDLEFRNEIKLKCVLEVIEKKVRPIDVVIRYQLPSLQILNNWIKIYEEKGKDYFVDKKVEPKEDLNILIEGMMSRVSPQDKENLEKIRIELDCLKKWLDFANKDQKQSNKDKEDDSKSQDVTLAKWLPVTGSIIKIHPKTKPFNLKI
ncbi:MAG: hypothetical protein EZS28_038011 [Streblomastix strix]|uniref:Uncharacterized protein n=1 Tax=Streblomastix strix TaxID=222440 RepID=A0A5J4U987_9EUKA|nr:MAG: hypothetical protein EZS28_038011 [Streblomastix strix]